MCKPLRVTLPVIMLVGLQGCILSLNGVTTASKANQQCGIVATETRAKIFGGEEVSLGAFPWIAIIGYTGLRDRRKKWNCGGSLINSRWVLTAAHCVDHRLLRKHKIAEVRLGEHTLGVTPDCQNSPLGTTCALKPQVFGVLDVVQWPHFSPSNITAGNDIALIKLDGEVTMTEWVSPVCLPSPDFKPNQDTIGIAAGWGLTENNIKSKELLSVSLPYINLANCRQKYDGGVLNSQLCFGGEANKDTCYGDSGGPLVVLDSMQQKYTLAGVVSYGISCGKADFPGIYTSVNFYLNWIQSIIQGTIKYTTRSNANSTDGSSIGEQHEIDMVKTSEIMTTSLSVLTSSTTSLEVESETHIPTSVITSSTTSLVVDSETHIPISMFTSSTTSLVVESETHIPISMFTSSVTGLKVEAIESIINTKVLAQSPPLSLSEEATKVAMDKQSELHTMPVMSTTQQAATHISSIQDCHFSYYIAGYSYILC